MIGLPPTHSAPFCHCCQVIFLLFMSGLSLGFEAHSTFFFCNTWNTGLPVCLTRSVFVPLFTLADIHRCIIGCVRKNPLLWGTKKIYRTVIQFSKCSSKLGWSLWDNMGSPWKGFVEFTLPASPPTAFVSADLSSTSPVGLSLSPYGRSVSSTFPPLFYVPTSDPPPHRTPIHPPCPASLL